MTQPTQPVKTLIPQTAEECKNVTHVNLAGAKHINKKISALLKGPALENLAVLDLSQGKNLKDDCIISCLQKFPTIRKLNLTGCRKITDATLIELAERLKGLTHLKLSVCPQITDKGLDSVVSNCKKLEYLNLTLDFNTCKERYKIEEAFGLASFFGVGEKKTAQVVQGLIDRFVKKKVKDRIEEKTQTNITLEGVQNVVRKCDVLKELFVPCILETKTDLLMIMLDDGKESGKTAQAIRADLSEEVKARGLKVLTYEKDPALVWASPQEWSL
jgi:hypothetical protein